jgi:DtxR family transcriptional regulator, Mn-dependent transcriptional regulator
LVKPLRQFLETARLFGVLVVPFQDMPKAPAQPGLEDQYLSTQERHDSAEEYLEALVMIEAEKSGLVPVGEVARKLRVTPPSAVQMLKRLAKKGLVEYVDRQGVRLTKEGRSTGTQMVRNGRLMEVFVAKTLGLPEDLHVAHAVEHTMTPRFADALCAFLSHPRSCPHGYNIPRGACCPGEGPN